MERLLTISHSVKPFEILLLTVQLCLFGMWFYLASCGTNYLRRRDLGMTLVPGAGLVVYFGPALIGFAVMDAPRYLWPLALIAYFALTLWFVPRKKLAADLRTKSLDTETSTRIQSLRSYPHAKPEVVVTSYSNSHDLIWWLDSRRGTIVIPERFASEAPAAEIVALGARQLAPSAVFRASLRPLVLIIAAQILMAACFLLGHSILFWAALPVAALAFVQEIAMLKSQDLVFDRAAIKLTGDPRSYISAIQRAVNCVPAAPFPWWFKPPALEVRVAAILQEFNLNSETALL